VHHPDTIAAKSRKADAEARQRRKVVHEMDALDRAIYRLTGGLTAKQLRTIPKDLLRDYLARR
jgi:hypothetical protein